ncbi:MAG TPA: TIM barrel protein [Planctomycetota bacterium]|nr:TIM barrel protein [Planctomycetota bacterium]
MSSFKQSFAWWSSAKGVEPQKLIKEAAKIGYKGVEMVDQSLWSACHDAGLQIATIGGHGTLTDGLNKRDNHARIEDEINKNLELAKKNNIHALIVFSGNRNGLDDYRGMDNTAEGLLRVKKAAEAANVTLVLELLNSKVDHKDYQCDRTMWGVNVVKRVNSPRVKLLYDIYHMQIMEGDIIRTIKENIEWIGHFHTAGNPGRRDLDTEQELYYPAIAKAITSTGYNGFVGQEFMAKADAIAALKHAFEQCNY